MKTILIVVLALIAYPLITARAQTERRDRAVFTEPKSEFMDSIRKSLDTFYKSGVPPKKALRPDFTAFDPPVSPKEFTSSWHNTPVAQALSGMCWCFSTTSFFESEVYRISKRQIKLSELYTVYWEYVEKARRFVR